MLSWMHQIHCCYLRMYVINYKLLVTTLMCNQFLIIRRSQRKSKRKRKSKKAKIKLIQTICLPADSSGVVQVEAKSIDIVYTPKDKQRKKSSQQSKEADNLLPTTGNQGGEQPRSPYNLRHRQRGLTRNINSRSSLVSEGICNSSGISHLIS